MLIRISTSYKNPKVKLEDFQLNYRVLNRGLYVQEAEIMTDDAGNQAVDSS